MEQLKQASPTPSGKKPWEPHRKWEQVLPTPTHLVGPLLTWNRRPGDPKTLKTGSSPLSRTECTWGLWPPICPEASGITPWGYHTRGQRPRAPIARDATWGNNPLDHLCKPFSDLNLPQIHHHVTGHTPAMAVTLGSRAPLAAGQRPRYLHF